jgi:hypothetical protein
LPRSRIGFDVSVAISLWLLETLSIFQQELIATFDGPWELTSSHSLCCGLGWLGIPCAVAGFGQSLQEFLGQSIGFRL